jgi:hypothetical protein
MATRGTEEAEGTTSSGPCQASGGPHANSALLLGGTEEVVSSGIQHSQGLVSQCLQLAPVFLPELLSPLSCIHGLRLAGHSTLHHLSTVGDQRLPAFP